MLERALQREWRAPSSGASPAKTHWVGLLNEDGKVSSIVCSSESQAVCPDKARGGLAINPLHLEHNFPLKVDPDVLKTDSALLQRAF